MKNRLLFTLAFVGLLAGVLVTWQFQTEVVNDSIYPGDILETKNNLIKNYLDEQAYLQSRIVSLRKEIENSQNNIETKSQTSNLALLENLKQGIGLKDAQGKGIEISLDDSPFAIREGAAASDENLVQASDIRDIVNVLSAAKATAIAVNNQRIIATSPISSVGTTILVNEFYISPPFTITAVGDPEIFIQRLTNEGSLKSLYERAAKSNVIYKIVVKQWLTVPMFNGNLKTDYINLIE